MIEAVKDDETSGGITVYFDHSHTTWWENVEVQNICAWIEEVTEGRLQIFTKPDDRIQRCGQKDGVTNRIKGKLKERKQELSQERHGADASMEMAVMVLVPVDPDMLHLRTYAPKCVRQFCEEKITAVNETEALCVVDVRGYSPRQVAEIVHDFYSDLDGYDVSVFTGVDPRCGPVSCVCIRVKMKI